MLRRAVQHHKLAGDGMQRSARERGHTPSRRAQSTAHQLTSVPVGNGNDRRWSEGKADASHLALQQFRDANLKLDAYAAACEAEAATSKALSAAKKAEEAAERAGPGGATETKHLAKFRAFVTKEALTPPTQYARSGGMQEWYAEAFSLWRADPTFFEDQYPKLKKWFDDGEHLKD